MILTWAMPMPHLVCAYYHRPLEIDSNYLAMYTHSIEWRWRSYSNRRARFCAL